jgi:hypothetical protein
MVMLKDTECEKGQLAQRPPIQYVPVVDLVTPKEDPAVFKVKLPDDSHISVPIFSHGNNEEYIAHIVAVLRIIEHKGLHKKCRMYAKAVVKWQAALKNLQEALEPQVTSVDVAARKVEIEQTSQMLQEAPQSHDKAIAESYEQLRNLLSGDAQSQWDRVCREMHKSDSWAAVNNKLPKVGVCERGCPSLTLLSYISSQSSVLTQLRSSGITFSKRCASLRGPLCNSISCKWEC